MTNCKFCFPFLLIGVEIYKSNSYRKISKAMIPSAVQLKDKVTGNLTVQVVDVAHS